MAEVRLLNMRAFERELRRFIDVDVPDQTRTAVRKAGFLLGEALVLGTPVDTGFARGGWRARIGTPDSFRGGTLDTTGAATLTLIATVLGQIRDPYVVLWFSNNTPYIDTLDRGGYRPANPSNEPEAMARRAAGRTEGQQKRAQSSFGHPGATFVRGGYSVQAPQGIVDIALQVAREGLAA